MTFIVSIASLKQKASTDMTDTKGVGVIYYLELNNCKTKYALCFLKGLLKCIIGFLIS